ncbi:MAG: hypothetical protein NZ585_00550 [Chloracidobacterium sp.]|nr:hypothetical protein [Chloracidobacterium sp.]MDW8216504.1 hypothetical protein [Acidobacteriota bacterium]
MPRITALLIVVGLGCGATAFALGLAAGQSLSARTAQQALQRALGGRYDRSYIRIRRILPGFSPSDAIVEAQIEATFKFTRTAQGWQATEVRLADRDWRRLDALTRALTDAPGGDQP